jgi:hypothetical protein
MKIVLVIYSTILAIIFLYIPSNIKIYTLVIEKYGRQKGGRLLKLFRLTGIILLSALVLRLFVIVLVK